MSYAYKWMEEAVIVTGANRECVYDIPRGEYLFVSSGFTSLKDRVDGCQVDHISDKFDSVEQEWIEFMVTNELVIPIPVELLENFAQVIDKFEIPSIVSNAVIEYGERTEEIITLLNEFNCRNVKFVVGDLKELIELLENHFNDTDFQSLDIEILSEKVDLEELKNLSEKYTIIGNIELQNFKDKPISTKQGFTRIFEKVKFDNGFYPMLIPNSQVYYESRRNNVFFNKKIFIDREGNLSLLKGELPFADIDTDFDLILNRLEYFAIKSIWTVTKDQTEVCKDCEFRRMCIDDRVPKANDNASTDWQYEDECSYNPYISKWKKDEGYVAVSEISSRSREGKLIIDHNKVAELNEKLWA